MKISILKKSLLLITVSGVMLFSGIGCTKYASEEDLQSLEMQKNAALSAEKKRDQMVAEKRKLDAQLEEKKTELQQVEMLQVEIQGKLEKKQAAQKDGGKK
ncbi:hypothetical protein K8I28_01155 [bacterium]|nr:hypothetical protein [bacterium]